MSGRCRGRGRGNARRRTVRNSPERDEGDEFDAYEDPLDIGITVKNEVICPEMFQTEDEVFGMVDSQNLVEEQQRMQQAYHLEAGSTDYHISQRLSSLERKMDFLLNINTRILARVDKICENMRTVTKPTDFPVKTKEGLETVDVKIANNMDKYIELFKSLLKPSGIIKNIGRILDQKLLMEMNYAGCSSKTGLSNYVNLNTALYESTSTEGYTFDDYKRDVRLAFAKAKNRVYKAKSEARRLEKMNEDVNDSKSEKKLTNVGIDISHLSNDAAKSRRNMRTVGKQNDFPVKTMEALTALDKKIANNMQSYIELFRILLFPNGIVKNIGLILDEELFMEMNYAGYGSKTGLSNYVNFNNALYESLRTEGYSFDDYKKDVRMAFAKAKNRVYKAKFEANRLKKLFEDNDDSSNDKEAQNNSNLNVEIIDNSHLSKIAVKCREKMKTLIKSNDFPVKTAEELEALDVKVANNMEQYIDLFKNVLMPSGIVKHIIRVIDVTLVMEMNYGGFGSKTGLSSYTNLDNALYRSQKTEGYSFDDYKKDVRLAFQRAKNRVYKAKHEANRLKKLKANNYGSKKEF
ncbi:uncharacterized protein LOC6556499 [Drosophila grimshawi]|uniref:uncharacterized protein LOC6556499 n=1 Tax=Drosophila grimshawi TaxID=7222 RepID=UPI000C8703D2|nr:uncharacterized protein LOC6556499 [Drosophila grimshawi]